MTDEARFGNYRVVEVMGTGALSTIYRAVQEPLGRAVAVKALKAQIAATSSFAEQLDREASILGATAHPNVVLLLDAGRTASGRPYVVLEHIDGVSVQALLAKKRKLPLEVALAIACGVAAALEHVHERGIVHRDVKPGNVLVTKGGVVKLIDFGIAQREKTASGHAAEAEGITPSGRMAPEALKDAYGTPAYMSPEQILGDFVDARSDLFSLGVVLYQMLSGTRPFEADDAPRGGSKSPRTRREAAAPLRDRAPNVPRAVERVVMRLLEKAPAERYADASSLREKLDATLRAMTRQDPAGVLRAALEEKSRARALAPKGLLGMVPRAVIGYAVVLAAFVAGVITLDGASAAPRDAPEIALAGAGGVRVIASPWAYVKVDGQDAETTPFARPIPLAPGKHWLTLTHPDAPSIEREVEIAAGEVVTVDVTMDLGTAEDAGRDAR